MNNKTNMAVSTNLQWQEAQFATSTHSCDGTTQAKLLGGVTAEGRYQCAAAVSAAVWVYNVAAFCSCTAPAHTHAADGCHLCAQGVDQRLCI